MMMNKKKPFSLHLDVDSFMPATAEEKEVISRMRPSSTFFRDGVKRLLKNKVATISLILIVLITLSSIIIPMFWPYSYDQMLGQTKGRPMDNSYNNLAPFQYGKTELKKIDKGESVFPHIFGTDAHGRDYFIRVVYGTRISLAVGFFASIIVLVIGMMIGAVAGYFGGRVDLFIMRIVDIIYSLPDTVLLPPGLYLCGLENRRRIRNAALLHAAQGLVWQSNGDHALGANSVSVNKENKEGMRIGLPQRKGNSGAVGRFHPHGELLPEYRADSGGNPEIGRVADSGEYAASGGFAQERAARAGKNPPADGKVLYAADFPPVRQRLPKSPADHERRGGTRHRLRPAPLFPR